MATLTDNQLKLWRSYEGLLRTELDLLEYEHIYSVRVKIWCELSSLQLISAVRSYMNTLKGLGSVLEVSNRLQYHVQAWMSLVLRVVALVMSKVTNNPMLALEIATRAMQMSTSRSVDDGTDVQIAQVDRSASKKADINSQLRKFVT